MVDVWLPYGKSQVCVRVPTRNFLGLVESKEKPGVQDPRAEIERALRAPLGSKKVSEIANPSSKVAIVVDDATKPTPTSFMVSLLLEELRNAGTKEENMVILFACGAHRAVAPDEAVRLLGESICSHVRTVSHDCKAQDLVDVGTTHSHGTKVLLNRVFMEADVRILTGDVRFHPFSGYTGGRDSVLPGISGEETVKHNHAMLLEANARVGNLVGNPVHEDMTEAAGMAKVDFVLNVVQNCKRDIVRAFAGNIDLVFSEGTQLVDEMYRAQVDRRADIAVVSSGGDPADVSLFQAWQGVENSLDVVKRGGVIILVAELPEGHGDQDYYTWMMKFHDLKAVEKELRHGFVSGGAGAYYHLKALQKVRIVLVSSMPDYYATNVFKLRTARAVNDALNEAFNLVGKSAKVWALPQSNFTLPEVKAIEEEVDTSQS